MSSTIWNVESLPLSNAAIATTMNAIETRPDNTFTRTGVPSRRLNTPKKPGKAPS